MNNIYDVFEELGIQYKKYKHPAVFTVVEAEKHQRGEGVHSKNLFLRNAKGDKHYLVVMDGLKRLDLKKLSELLQESKLSFASPKKLPKYLGVTPGSVSPFALIHDTNKEVQVVVDEGLLKADKQGFHPNINTATLVISTEDLKKFLAWTGNRVIYIPL